MTSPTARPVLKWAGGKARSLPQILEALPRRVETYYEPFVGGAAVFFALAAECRFKKAVLSDSNADLIEVYRQLRDHVDAVIRTLRRYRYDEDHYYEVRAQNPKELSRAERAARTIFLNKTGYNGLYRVNSKGQFNVPFGRYKKPNFCDIGNLKAASRALQSVELEVGDFEKTSSRANPGDAVYFDPPYDPVSKTASFIAYHKDDFGRDEHQRLAETAKSLASRGVSVVLSNSFTPFTKGLYDGFASQKIAVSRPINSKVSARGAVYELLVSSRMPK